MKAVDRTTTQLNLILTIRVFVLSACSFRHDFFFLYFLQFLFFTPLLPLLSRSASENLIASASQHDARNYVWICACNSNLASQQASRRKRPCLRQSCIVKSPVGAPVSPPYFPSAFIIPVLDFIRSQTQISDYEV